MSRPCIEVMGRRRRGITVAGRWETLTTTTWQYSRSPAWVSYSAPKPVSHLHLRPLAACLLILIISSSVSLSTCDLPYVTRLARNSVVSSSIRSRSRGQGHDLIYNTHFWRYKGYARTWPCVSQASHVLTPHVMGYWLFNLAKVTLVIPWPISGDTLPLTSFSSRLKAFTTIPCRSSRLWETKPSDAEWHPFTVRSVKVKVM